MDLSSSHIHVKPNSPRALPNVVKFHFSHLRKVRGHRKINGQPKRCRNRECKAILLISAKCSFCHAVNENDDIPQEEEIEYIINKNINTENERYIVFCLDMSELMEIYRPVIKTAVIDCLRDINTEAGNKRVVLVTFNNDISIHFPISGGQIKSFSFPGSHNTYQICDFIRTYIDRFRVDYIANNLEVLTDKVLNFENSGKAALGPALYFSVLIAKKWPRSSVYLFTNGLANLGQGALENDSGERLDAADFYNVITDIAQKNKVSVSIASIEGEDRNLGVLRDVANETEGQIFTLNPANLEEIRFDYDETTSILLTVANDVYLTILVPKGLIIKDSINRHSDSNILTKKIGNVTKKTEIGFEIAGTSVCRNLIGTKIPIQLELSYKSDEGSDVIRVIRINREVTEDDKLVEKNTDRCILGSYLIRTMANFKNVSDEFVSLALTINDTQTAIKDRFNRDIFFREACKVGLDLGYNYLDTNNQNTEDDNTVVFRCKSSEITSDHLRKENKNK